MQTSYPFGFYTRTELDNAVQAAREAKRREINDWISARAKNAGMDINPSILEVEARINILLTLSQNKLTCPSPCGQKFQDGTPHPMACWIEGAHAPHDGDMVHRCGVGCLPGHCLICASEQKLREEIAALRYWITENQFKGQDGKCPECDYAKRHGKYCDVPNLLTPPAASGREEQKS